MSWRGELTEAFRNALSKTFGIASEIESLREALSIADDWQMRLDELEEEEEEERENDLIEEENEE